MLAVVVVAQVMTADFEEYARSYGKLYAKFCHYQSVRKSHAIKDGKESMEELSAANTDTFGRHCGRHCVGDGEDRRRLGEDQRHLG